MLLPLLGFLFIALLVAGAAMALAPARGGVIEQRLGELRGMPGLVVEGPSPYGESVKRSFTRLGKYAPTSAAEMGKLKGRLVCAGYRGAEALPVFIGARLGCALLAFGLASTPLVGRPNLMLALGGAALGYMLPGFVLARDGEEATASDSTVAGRRARPARRLRRSGSGPRPGAAACRRRAGVRAQGSVRRAPPREPRAARRARRAPTRSATWPIAPASTICRRWRRC